MKILITGSSGHLGEALVRRCKTLDHQTIGIDILPSPFTDRVGSIDDPNFVQEVMQGIDVVFHAATLHKPHVATHSKQEFVNTNITGTLQLLEAASQHKVHAFIFTSTTSTFGDAMKSIPGAPAVWVTETTSPIPKNIYGATKIAAEDLCQLFHRNHQLACLILKTSRFFLEEDDNARFRENYQDPNIKVNEFLHRRVDVEDIVSAHFLAMEKAKEIGFARYIISATSPFSQKDVHALKEDAPTVLKRLYPHYEEMYDKRGWKMFPSIGRVYDNSKARKELGWQPKYDFQYVLERLTDGLEFCSPLASSIGKKGYHDQEFEEGPYPV